MTKINLNADMAESWGPYTIGADDALIGIVGSANIACGAHAGEPRIMDATLRAAQRQGVSVGAHPGYPDLKNFGRVPMDLPPEVLRAELWAQIGALCAIGKVRGWPVTHVKPHGAMNNQAGKDPALARTIAEAIAEYDSDLILLAPIMSPLASAGQDAGLRVALEVFADRSYEPDGQLTPRSLPGAVMHELGPVRKHLLSMLESSVILCRDGTRIEAEFHSICVHGDGPAALAIAEAARQCIIDTDHIPATLPETLGQ
ncbi:LamB/YcsF family protein [Roseovarius sp. S4756]|uniref:LamB/YcsF family protein n=1 Tax=Roseovarius maritimus TaxID=3342637 RepID=UPI00372A6480